MTLTNDQGEDARTGRRGASARDRSERPPRVCVFAAAPPPVHGSTYAVQLLLSSDLRTRVALWHIDTRYSDSVAEIGSPSWRKSARFGRYLLRLVALCRRERIDWVVIAPAFSPVPFYKDALAVIAAAWTTGARIVLWGHSNDVQHFVDHSPRWRRRLLASVLRKARRIVVCGEGLEGNFTAFVDPSRISAIPNALPGGPVARAARPDGSPLHVLFLSNMLAAKGWRVVLAAAEEVCRRREDVVFTFAGSPSADSSPEEISTAFARTECPERIRYVGRQDGRAKEDLLASADVLCLPSEREAMPLTILEAMQYGLAVIATPVGAVPSAVLPDLGGFLVPPGDAQAVAEAVLRLASDRAMVGRMSRFNQQRFQERFTLARFVDSWANLFAESQENSTC